MNCDEIEMTTCDSTSNELSNLVAELLVEFRGFDGPNERNFQRDYVTAAVLIHPCNTLERHQGFSRDISDDGVGLITASPFESGTAATIAIDRFDGTAVQLESVCRWCRNYGPNWFLTGWQFIRLIGMNRY